MSCIVFSILLSGYAERLARRRARPDFHVIGNPGQAQRVRPAADPGEEVALRELAQIVGFHVEDAAVVHDAIGDQPGLHQFAQPRCGLGVIVVEVSRHTRPSSALTKARTPRPAPSEMASATNIFCWAFQSARLAR